jgi:3-deoxy-manno-octulosonate cytidylyltransferase (CMP-KDO synthetase)
MSDPARDPSPPPEAPRPLHTIAVIPARYASVRFPGKVLALLHGATILERVYRRASRIRGLARTRVATDDTRIAEEVRRFGGEVEMTSFHHASGTDRIGEVLGRLEPRPEVVLNLQGDEPLIRPRVVERLLAAVWGRPDAIWTLAEPIHDPEEFVRSSVVKVVCAGDGRALYFSRAPIPYDRGSEGGLPASGPAPAGRGLFPRGGVCALRHVGVYAYPVPLLERFLALPASPLESVEALEQLRALESGIPVRVLPEAWPEAGVDTPEDLRRLHERYPGAADLERTEEA